MPCAFTHTCQYFQGDSGGPLVTYKKIKKNGRIIKKAFLIGDSFWKHSTQAQITNQYFARL